MNPVPNYRVKPTSTSSARVASRKTATARYPYGYERAEDLAGIGVAAVIWVSAAVAGAESLNTLVHHGPTHHLGWGIGPSPCPGR